MEIHTWGAQPSLLLLLRLDAKLWKSTATLFPTAPSTPATPLVCAQLICKTEDPCPEACSCPTETHMCTNGKCKAAFERPTPFLVAHNNYTAEVAAADAGQVTLGWEWRGCACVA